MRKLLKRFNYYRAAISMYLFSQHDVPTPDQVLSHLLAQYSYSGKSGCLFELFKISQLNTKLVNDIQENIQEGRSWIQCVEDSLVGHQLQKKTELFILFLAFFYCYNDFFSSLSDLKSLQEQMICRTELLRVHTGSQCLADILSRIDDLDKETSFNAIKVLINISVPAEKKSCLVKRLLEKLSIADTYSYKDGYIVVYPVAAAASEALANMEISNDLMPQVLSTLMEYIDDDRGIPVCIHYLFSRLRLTESMCYAVADQLFDIVDSAATHTQKANAWFVLKVVGVPKKRFDDWLAFNRANSRHGYPFLFNHSVEQLSLASAALKAGDTPLVSEAFIVKTNRFKELFSFRQQLQVSNVDEIDCLILSFCQSDHGPIQLNYYRISAQIIKLCEQRNNLALCVATRIKLESLKKDCKPAAAVVISGCVYHLINQERLLRMKQHVGQAEDTRFYCH